MTGVAHVVSFAGSHVLVECIGAETETLVSFLFAELPRHAAPVPHIAFRVEIDSVRRIWTLARGHSLIYQAQSAGDLAITLLGQMMYDLSERCTSGLLLHAAAVVRDNQCLLFPGSTGTGKTTLTAWLVANGFEYLTDELVYVPLGSDTIVPFVRPLSVKRPAMTALRERLPTLDISGRYGTENVTLVPVSALGSVAQPAARRVNAVVFPRFEQGTPLEAGTISKADAGMQLMGSLINARNLTGHGFSEAVRLARDVPVSRLRYGRLDQLETWLASTGF